MTSLTQLMMAKLPGYLRISLERVAIWLLLMTQISSYFSSPEYMPLAGIRVQEWWSFSMMSRLSSSG